VDGASARHDRVVWALAEGAMQRGVEVHQRIAVTGLLRNGERVVGVETDQGPIAAGRGRLSHGRTRHHAGRPASVVRLPIRTHPLQAFVTNHYETGFNQMVASSNLLFYVSQTARGEMLIGAEIDRQPGYSYQSGYHFLQSCSFRAMTLLPFLRQLRILRQWTGVCDMSPDYSPVMGADRRRWISGHYRLGDVGLQGDSGRRGADGRTDCDRPHPGADRPLRARPFREGSDDGRSRLGRNSLRRGARRP
jgi:sarcosine oxidase subunit beta